MLNRIRSKLDGYLADHSKTLELQRRTAYEAIRANPRYADPRHLARAGYKCFSQNDEDGIIAEIFRRLDVRRGRFIEFGLGDGLENNTLALLFAAWSGLWIEGSPRYCARIRSGFDSVLGSGQLRLVESFITRDNIDSLIAPHLSGDIDLLSVDIDGNDYEVLHAIRCVTPKVIVIEYNAKFGPSISWCMPYSEAHAWKRNDNFGVSLKYLEERLDASGYRLVGCNISGTNAFFVRDDLVGDRFLGPHTAEHHWEPARYELVGMKSGHPCSYEKIEALRSASAS